MIGKARFETFKAEKELTQKINAINSQMNGGCYFMTSVHDGRGSFSPTPPDSNLSSATQ